jgi:hypothetical protein
MARRRLLDLGRGRVLGRRSVAGLSGSALGRRVEVRLVRGGRGRGRRILMLGRRLILLGRRSVLLLLLGRRRCRLVGLGLEL